MRNRFSALLLATTSLLAACSADKTAGDGGGTVIVSMGADAASLHPLLVADETGTAVTDVLFDHLAEIGDGMSTIGDAGFSPRLAKSWDWSRDSMSITFHLDPAARFHDGVPVKASDVRYTAHLARDTTLGSQVTAAIQNVDSVSVTDSLTAVVWFKARSPEQFYDVAYQLAILPEHVYGKVEPVEMKTSEVMRQPVGSGRFRLAKWEPGVRVEIVADTANYRGRPSLDRVIFMVNQAPTTAATAVLAGQSDFMPGFPIDQVARLDSSPVARPQKYTLMGYGFMGMNLNDRKTRTRPHPVLSEAAVRRAISMSLDRRAMLANVFNNAGVLAYGPFALGTVTADTTLRLPAYDTTAAKALLDSAGWKPGPRGIRMKNGRPLRFELMVPSVSVPRMRYSDLIQEQLNRVGFQVEMAKIPAAQFGPRVATGDYDAMLMAVNTDPNAAGAKEWWTTGAITSGNNFIGYRNPAFDVYLDSATRAHDPASVKRYASRAYQILADDAPAVWLYSPALVAAVNRRIEARPFRPDGWWAHLADWSIPSDKRIDRDRIGLRPQTP